MIETRLLVYFLAVARELNITKAAESLFLSQSTLSKQMQELERQLGKQLFLRGGRKLTLTDDGIYLRDRAQEIVTLMEQTENALAGENKSLNGDLTIGCGETIAMDVIGGMMANFQRQHPDVKLHTFSGDADAVRERIDKGLCDMGLLLGPMRQERYDYLNIYTKDIYGLLMRDDDPLAAQDEINIDQLKSLPIILADQTFYGHQDLDWFGCDESVLQVVATYNLIYNANTVLANVDGVEFSDELTKKQFKGEALFLRALAHFELVRSFGRVPIIDHVLASTQEAKTIPQSEGKDVILNSVIPDLLEAEKLLPYRAEMKGSTGKSIAGEGRADKLAAQALLARVYMTLKGYPYNDASAKAQAKSYLETVVKNGASYFAPNMSEWKRQFLTDNTAANKYQIFGIQHRLGTGNQLTFISGTMIKNLDIVADGYHSGCIP